MIQGYYTILHSRFSPKNRIKVLISGFSRPSENKKTGPMLQVYVIHDAGILASIRNETDYVQCGSCPLRRSIDGGCYVVERSLYSLDASIRRGNYIETSKKDLLNKVTGHNVRITSYGDPGAIDSDVWSEIINRVKNYTGYTHFPWMLEACKGRMMASCQSLSDAKRLWDDGWKTFRIVREVSEKTKHEVVCPNYHNKNIQCIRCALCKGAKTNIVNPVHGILASRVFSRKEV